MPVVVLKPNGLIDTNSNVASGSWSQVDEDWLSFDGTTMDSVANEWTGGVGATFECNLSNLPADAGSINSWELRARAGVGGDATPDDTIEYTFEVYSGAILGSANIIWDDADSAASPNLVNRTATESTSPGTVTQINNAQIRMRLTAWTRNMGSDGMFLSIDAIQLEVDYELQGATDQDYLHLNWRDDPRLRY
jgi:hypothetical protein